MNKLFLASLLILTVSTVYSTEDVDDKKVSMEAVHKVVKEFVSKVPVSEEVKGELQKVFDKAFEKGNDMKQLGTNLGKFIAEASAEDKKAIIEFYQENHEIFEKMMEEKEEELRKR